MGVFEGTQRAPSGTSALQFSTFSESQALVPREEEHSYVRWIKEVSKPLTASKEQCPKIIKTCKRTVRSIQYKTCKARKT